MEALIIISIALFASLVLFPFMNQAFGGDLIDAMEKELEDEYKEGQRKRNEELKLLYAERERRIRLGEWHEVVPKPPNQ